jgi:hypothetical protein
MLKPSDSLQLIDLALIKRIVSLDAEGAWAFVLDNLDHLRSLDRFPIGCLYALEHGFDHFENCFYRDWHDDHESMLQGLINELGFIGEGVPLHFFARGGYLDHPSSTKVQTSRDLIPQWSRESDAQDRYCLFDVLDADHVGLMAEAMRKNRKQIEPDKYLDSLKIEVIEKACRKNPTLRAAYIYDPR